MKVGQWLNHSVMCQNHVNFSGCEDGDTRLVGGGSIYEGRVEMCYNDNWGTICDDLWGENDARVVCRQLEFSTQSKFIMQLLTPLVEKISTYSELINAINTLGATSRMFPSRTRSYTPSQVN